MEQFEQSKEVLSLYEKYEKPIQQIFEHFQEYNDVKITSAIDKQTLQMKGVVQFAQQFNIVPGVMQLQELTVLYNSLMKESTNNEKGMSLGDFRHFLTRLSIQNRNYFDRIYEKFKPNEGKEDSRQKQMQGIIDDEKKLDKKKKSQNSAENLHADLAAQNGDSLDDDQQPAEPQQSAQDVLQTSSKTIEGLISYMNFPVDKNQLTNRLKQMKLDSTKSNGQY